MRVPTTTPGSEKAARNVPLIIWGALSFSSVALIGIGWFVLWPQVEPTDGGSPITPYIPLVMAWGALMTGIIIPAMTGRNLDISNPSAFINVLTIRTVLRMALFESIGIYGLIGVYLGTSRQVCLPIMVIGSVVCFGTLPWILGQLDKHAKLVQTNDRSY